MSDRKLSAMTEDEIVATIRAAVRAEFSAAGLRVDDSDDQDEARRDFMFLRSLRQGAHGAAAKVGMAIILAITSGIVWLIMAGLGVWRNG